MADSVKQEVLAVVKVWVERFNNEDFHAMMECLTDDIVLFTPTSDPAIGKKEALLVVTGFHSSGAVHATNLDEGLLFDVYGDNTADAIFSVDVMNHAGETILYLKEWLIFKKINGKWLVHRFAYSPRTKPAGAKSTS